ncbi:hypothetical protein BP5796_06737 [Coleophoma crateriformis]|uniref:Circumsporozoite protein n=1 Tax=Coleophoma crateriformis TaxID=565419 RepID=A0A3D8RPN7_9HELO|nr:hypothetical protein BP5796_06737 [Coleophoma crateriformis]
MYSKATLLAILVAVSEARFNQEQVPIAAIGAVKGGTSGQAATEAGTSIQTLLAAANPCDKLKKADEIVATLGTGADSIAAARGLAGAEQNFNPFVVSIPTICSDPTLPTTLALRGVVPLVDPSVVGSTVENANAKLSLTTPFTQSAGMSVADVMVANGFTNFTTTAADGTKGVPNTSGAVASTSASNSTASTDASSVSASSVAASAVSSVASGACGTTMVTVTRAATSAATSAATAAAAATTAASVAASNSTSAAGAASTATCATSAVTSDPVTGSFAGFVASTDATLDFGCCVPTMKFEAGLNGRKTTESTFQAIDPLVNKGQQEALNPAIIMNRIVDQLTNVCQANAAAKAAAKAAMTASTNAKDVSTADAWNTALGFAGTNTNPDNAPQTGLVGHT